MFPQSLQYPLIADLSRYASFARAKGGCGSCLFSLLAGPPWLSALFGCFHDGISEWNAGCGLGVAKRFGGPPFSSHSLALLFSSRPRNSVSASSNASW